MSNMWLRLSKLSASPCKNRSGSSPPVGFVPKSFPPFQHPIHKLLEENGFKQQLYNKYHKRCLNDRKKMSIGCSEVVEMDSILQAHGYIVPSREILEAIAQRFSNKADRSGKVEVSAKQIWNLFQNM